MRPYLAVLKDSFREALASRVLWILIIVTTVLLVLVAPLGFKEEKATRLRRNSVRNWPELAAKIKAQGADGQASPGSRIWSRLSDDLKAQLARFDDQSGGEGLGDFVGPLVDELNDVLGDRSFYDAAAWKEFEPGDEAADLLKRGVASLSGEDVVRLNRLLLEAAYPDEIPRDEGSEIYIAYLGWTIGGALPMTRKQVTPAIKAVLGGIVNFFVGTLGVLAAILVTAPIIPHTFEAGAIDLLLSKPVSRSFLFLTKFVGGCAFITINAAYFIIGMWLIAGTRFDVWSGKLLWCIPLFLFLFAIYYCVSALAGVLWRNAIVSVVVTILFWATCFTVGTAKNLVEQFSINPSRLVKVIPAGQALLAVDELGQTHEWRARDSAWSDVFTSDVPAPPAAQFVILQPMIGPIYDASQQRIVAIQLPPPSGGFSLFGPASTLLIGTRASAWARSKGPVPPVGVFAMFLSPHGEVVVLTKGAVFRLVREVGKKGKPEEVREKFVRSGPEPALRLDASAAAAMNPDTGAIVVFGRGTVSVLEPDAAGKYARKIEKEIAGSKNATAAVLAFGGSKIVLALSDGRTLVLDAADLMVKQEYRPARENPPRFAAASPGGRWLTVLFHNHRLWMYDTRENRPAEISLTGQGDISAAAFDGPDRLLAVDRATRATVYQLDPFRVEEHRAAAMGNLELGYYFGLVPLYTVFPKPGELDNVVSYLLTEQETVAIGPNPQDLAQRRIKVDITGPIYSSLAFLGVVLALSCVYVWRSDF